MRTASTRIARRYLVRQAAREVVASTPRLRTASADSVRRELTAEVLEAFGSAYRGPVGVRTAGSLTARLKQLWEMFQSSPKAWEDFKHLIGLKADGALALVSELPSKIKAFVKEGEKVLRRIGDKLKELPPLALYFDIVKAAPSVTKFLGNLVEYLPPSVQRAVLAIHSRAKSLAAYIDDVIDQYPVALPVSAVMSAAAFTVIWLNVYEVSWDVPTILRGFLGGFSWTELLDSLPESALGFMLSLMFPGIPTGLLFKVGVPTTLALRILWLYNKGLLEYRPGKFFRVRWDKMNTEPPEGAVSTLAL